MGSVEVSMFCFRISDMAGVADCRPPFAFELHDVTMWDLALHAFQWLNRTSIITTQSDI